MNSSSLNLLQVASLLKTNFPRPRAKRNPKPTLSTLANCSDGRSRSTPLDRAGWREIRIKDKESRQMSWGRRRHKSDTDTQSPRETAEEASLSPQVRQNEIDNREERGKGVGGGRGGGSCTVRRYHPPPSTAIIYHFSAARKTPVNFGFIANVCQNVSASAPRRTWNSLYLLVSLTSCTFNI